MSIENLSEIWPSWEIEKQIGKGSYGTVYQAVRRNESITSRAAIKVITIPIDSSELDSLRSEGLSVDASKTYLKGVVDDFVNEIKLMESFKGIQNIVSVEDYEVVEKKDSIGWNIYIRMELLTPFNNHVCDKALTEDEVIKLGTDICTALEICAKRDIIHRDIKPENIFINDFGSYKLGDFGIARKMANMTGGFSTKGTPYYMAPEVFAGNNYDARVDIYSLGIVMYKLLNQGRLPFLDTEKQLLDPTERMNALERRKSGEKLMPPCEASKEMAEVVLKACAHNPADRFANATEFKKALESVKNGTYVAAVATPDKDKLGKTTAVQNPVGKDSLGETTPIREKPPVAEPVQPGGNTFSPRDKKSGGAKGAIIASLIILVVFAAVGIFGYFYLENRLANKPKDNDDDAETTEITTMAVAVETTAAVTEDPSIAEIQSILDLADKYLDDGNQQDAINEVTDGLNRYPDSAELKEKLEECYESLRVDDVIAILEEANEYAKDGGYNGAIRVLERGLEKYPDDTHLKEKLDEYTVAMTAESVNSIIENATTYAEDGYYQDGLNLLASGLDTYPGNSDLKAKLDEYTEKRDAATKTAIADAEQCAKSGDFRGAYMIINSTLIGDPNSTVLSEKLAEYEKEINIENAISDADALANDGEYIDAVAKINEAVETYGENEKLSTAAATYEDTYATTVTAQIDKYLNENNVDAATELFDTAAKAFPENEQIAEYSEKIKAYSSETSVLLNTLEPINGGFTWNDGTPADPFESDYSNVKNYMIYHHNNDYWTSDECRDAWELSAEYRIDGKYDVLKLNISPYSDYGQSASSYIMVYADNVLRYVSPKIYQKSGITSAEIDISSATYLKIVIVKGGYGCIMLSDVVLEKIPGYVSKQKEGYTLFNHINVLNGGFTWNDEYPQNVLGDSYMNVANYMIYHHNNDYWTSDDCRDAYTIYTECYINNKYTSISFDIAPYTDYGKDAVTRVKVYVDDELEYTSPDITQKTAKFNTGNIDLTGASYVKVVVEKGAYGCVILSDMLLKNAT